MKCKHKIDVRACQECFLDWYLNKEVKKANKLPMPATLEECLREIDDETHKCAWHSKGFDPARRARLISYGVKVWGKKPFWRHDASGSSSAIPGGFSPLPRAGSTTTTMKHIGPSHIKEQVSAQRPEAKRASEARLIRDAWRKLKSCKHSRTIRRNVCGFSCSVAGPNGEENRAAHGNIECDEYCPACGCSRPLNINGAHIEYGDWHPDAQAIEEASQ